MRLRVAIAALVLALLSNEAASSRSSSPSVAQARPLQAPIARPIHWLIRNRIKHIFIIYQENRSFDSVFGTFPGADGVWSPGARTHGFAQTDPVTGASITPFRIVEPDVDDADHSRPALIKRMDDGRMDRYVALEAKRALDRGYSNATASGMGELTMSHIDCDTIPYLWLYAKRFTLFDRFFQGMTGPSTPGNIELIGAQTGQTQAARHPEQAIDPGDAGPGVPVVNDTYQQFGPYNQKSYAAVKKQRAPLQV